MHETDFIAIFLNPFGITISWFCNNLLLNSKIVLSIKPYWSFTKSKSFYKQCPKGKVYIFLKTEYETYTMKYSNPW